MFEESGTGEFHLSGSSALCEPPASERRSPPTTTTISSRTRAGEQIQQARAGPEERDDAEPHVAVHGFCENTVANGQAGYIGSPLS
eukprot:6494432-Heterocapsa_arctica.AAC.1